MNNYFKNQLRRTKCGLFLRVKFHVMAVLCPGEMRRMWRNHATEMQNQLNDNNWERHRFYVGRNHEVAREWLRVLNYGYFVYDPTK